MLTQISHHIKNVLVTYSADDKIIFNNTIIPIQQDRFNSVIHNNEEKTIAFIDGGQAEILSSGNFCLSFIRVCGIVFKGNTKVDSITNEFYIFTKVMYENSDILYQSTLFPVTEKCIDEQDLLISSNDQTIKTGKERAPISKVTNMARRFAEIALANQIHADSIILDGTLEPTFKNEEKYIAKLPGNVCALAKTSSLCTTSGNSPVILLNKISPQGCWSYHVHEKTSFVKLHDNAKHVFRFEGDNNVLSSLLNNCTDALFLGYPYGLLLADRMARVSNSETKSFKMKFLLNKDNKDIAKYLHSSNAHDILDNLG